MGTDLQNIHSKNSFSKTMLWVVFGLYIAIAGYTMFHHELWGDEFHSWNIAKGSNSFFDLIQNRRYEGHPPVWYIVLWCISKFTHNLAYVQLVHLTIAILVIFVMFFYSPLPASTKAILPFGYYFFFEYAILSRNYAIAILAGFLVCVIINKEFKYKFIVYYSLLLIMSNVHVLAMILAVSLHLYFLISLIEQKKKRRIIALHALLGVLIFLPSIYFISLPPDSHVSILNSLHVWNQNQFAIDLQAPLRAFVPMPAWWEQNFWNMQFIMELHNKYKALKIISPLLALALVLFGCFILKDNKKSLALFVVNTIATFLLGNIFTLSTQRYTGFIFIGFIVAYWLYCYDVPVQKNKKIAVNILLFIQLIAGVFIVYKDIELPFSNEYRVKELVDEVPANDKFVTDYSTLNAMSACLDDSFYCVDVEHNFSFLLWGKDKSMLDNPYRYFQGVNYLFQKERIKTVYVISILSPKALSGEDAKLFSSFHVQLTDKIDGAIEKGSNLYLYQISVIR